MSEQKTGDPLPAEDSVKLRQPLRILLLEDTPTDAELNERMLHKAGIDFTSLRVETPSALLAALDDFRPDIILADFNLPQFDGLQALSIVREHSPDLPCIFVSGAMGDEQAVELIKQGATDYILKDRLTRLPAAVQHAMAEQHAKQQHRESEEKFRKISESAQDAIILMGADQRVSFWNAAAVRIFGYTAAEAVGQELHALITPVEAHAKFLKAFPHFQESGEGAIIGKVTEVTALRKGGEEFSAELSISSTRIGGQWHAIGLVRDITERKQAEQNILATQAELQRLLVTANQSRKALLSLTEDQKRSQTEAEHASRALAALSAVNSELVHASDETELLQAICRVIVEQRSYRAAWVGYAQQDAEKTVRPMAQFGFEAGYMDTLQITWADSVRGQGPTGKAVRSGMTQIVQDVANDPGCAPWREQALKHGSASAVALPLFDDAEILGSLTIYAAEANAFNQDEITLLEEMASDLTFGIRMLRLRQKQKQYAELLRKSLEGTVLTIAAMVEMRDPYTAGHQRRVADLATAIAVKMGLSEEQARGIHLAGTIHDLGKIQTPAEILSKPGKLSTSEFNLIKDHPQNGYEILKGIDFPWPIAQMVLQHHERLDGTGYPQGLKGEAILLEARIISVADVVEAMSSHRPYRAGLGIDVALSEIVKGRGVHYDPQVVDACVSLFREHSYSFKN